MENLNSLERRLEHALKKNQEMFDKIEEDQKTKYGKTLNSESELFRFKQLLEYEIRQRRDLVSLVQTTVAPIQKF